MGYGGAYKQKIPTKADHVLNDHGETKDLSKQQPELLEELRNAWDVYSTEVGVVLSE